MESNLSCLSSLEGEAEQIYIQPHYTESYRLAIYALLCGGREAYDAFLRAEHISHFLSEEEITFILENARPPEVEEESEQRRGAGEASASTYLPTESDEEVPDLELGWPGVDTSETDTSISLLFHPPRRDTPTIKEVVRKHVQHAKQVRTNEKRDNNRWSRTYGKRGLGSCQNTETQVKAESSPSSPGPSSCSHVYSKRF